jgi:PAS domain S-box-containing protein
MFRDRILAAFRKYWPGAQISGAAESSDEFLRRTALLSEAQKLANLGWWELDLMTGAVWWSNDIYEMLGLEPQSIDLTSDVFYEFLRPDERSRIEKVISNGIESGEPISYSYWMVSPGGDERFFESEGKFVLDDNGTPIRLVGTVLETTTQKRTEADLRKSEFLLSAAPEIAHLGNWEFDVERNTLRWSDETYRLLGANKENSDPTLEDFLGYVHPDDRSMAETEVENSLTTGVDIMFEHRIVRPDGTERIVFEHGRATRDDHGLVTLLFGTVLDVTDARRIEQSLRKSSAVLERKVEQRTRELAATLNTLIEGVICIDERGTIEAFNPSAEKLFGYDAEEVVGQNVRCLMTAQDSAQHDHRISDYLNTGDAKIIGLGREVVGQRKDGSIFPMMLGIGEMEIDGHRKFVGTVHDVTDRRQVEDQLSAQAALLKRAEESAHVGHFRRPLAGAPLYWSDELYRIFGVDQETFIPTRENVFATLHPDDFEEYSQLTDAVAASGGSYEAHNRIIRPDGEIRHIRLDVETETAEDGTPVAIFGVVKDVTDVEQAEAGLRLREAELSQSERALRNITELTPVGIYQSDPDSHLTYVNDRWCRITGLSGEAALGNNWIKAIHPDDLEGLLAKWQTFIDSGEQLFETNCRIVRPDGETLSTISRATKDLDESGRLLGYVGSLTDVTELKEAEEALVQSEHDLQTMTTLSPVGIFHLDAHGAATYSNDRWWQIMGRDRETNSDEDWPQWLHPDDRDQVLRNWETANAENRSFNGEFRMITADGEERWILGQARPELDATGKRIGHVGSITDISAQKKGEQAIAESEGMFRALTENTADFTLIISQEGVCMYVGPAAEKVSGFKIGEIVGQHFQSFSTPEDKDLVSSVFNDALGNPSQTIHLPHFRAGHKDGGIIHYEAQVTNMLDIAGVNGIVVNMRDISERKRVELQAEAARSAAEQNKQRLNDAIESIKDGFMLFDADDKLVACNSAYRLRLAEVSSYLQPGTPFEELIRAIYRSDNLVAAEERNEENIRQRIRAHKHPEAGSRTIRTAEGGWVQLREYRTHDGGIAAIRTDITARVVAEQDALRARDEAESANRAKSDFLSSMSHELRTPMNAVLGFAQILEQDDQVLSDNHKEYVAEILRSGHHMMDLINEVLDLATVESGNISLDLKAENPRPLIDSCLHMVEATAHNGGISVRSVYPGKGLPQIMIDTVRFKQILLNLLSNGIKYNRPNGELILECETRVEGELRISVTDTGEGIPESRQAKVFEPFDRLGLEDSVIPGTGIGLTVTKRLIESMGGKIGFTSTEGEGTTFWITVPVTAASVAAETT